MTQPEAQSHAPAKASYAAPLISGGKRTEKVYQALLAGIGEGRFKVRSRLPTENELAEIFGVSRPVVRKALALLRQEGLVRSIQGSGTVVIGSPDATSHETGHVDSFGGSVRDLQRCFEFRILIEGEAAHAAALRHTPRTYERLAESVYGTGNTDAHPGPNQAYQTFEFHRAVVEASDNAFLQQSLDLIVSSAGFRVYLSRRDRAVDTVSHLAQVNAEHMEILRLIERRQATEARETMRGHIQRAYDHFMERIPVLGGSEHDVE